MDPELADRFASAFRRVFAEDDKDELIALATSAVDVIGGRLFDGFRQPPH
jgi:hypothetical protein